MIIILFLVVLVNVYSQCFFKILMYVLFVLFFSEKKVGGAERLIVDAACELVSHGHDVHVLTAHHDKNQCFEETVSGDIWISVSDANLPNHINHNLRIC